jgi:hypothetical protein
MAASDYTIRGSGLMAPYAQLTAAVAHGDTTLAIGPVRSNDPSAIYVGMTVMVGAEIMRVVSVAVPNVTVERGCADTIPMSHESGTACWFFDSEVGTDDTPYGGGSTVGVKILPYTTSGGNVPIENAPPLPLNFNWRHVRPYPPGRMRCDGEPWFTRRFVMLEGVDELTFTWAHRDRLLQSDQLIDHLADSIGPEPGTTYAVRVYLANGTLLRSESVTGTVWEYLRSMAEIDFSSASGADRYVEIESLRDGFASLAAYIIDIRIMGLVEPGLGDSLGENLGG